MARNEALFHLLIANYKHRPAVWRVIVLSLLIGLVAKIAMQMINLDLLICLLVQRAVAAPEVGNDPPACVSRTLQNVIKDAIKVDCEVVDRVVGFDHSVEDWRKCGHNVEHLPKRDCELVLNLV